MPTLCPQNDPPLACSLYLLQACRTVLHQEILAMEDSEIAVADFSLFISLPDKLNVWYILILGHLIISCTILQSCYKLIDSFLEPAKSCADLTQCVECAVMPSRAILQVRQSNFLFLLQHVSTHSVFQPGILETDGKIFLKNINL